MPVSSDSNTEVLRDIGILDHYPNSRYRVYPQNIASGIVVVASGVVNTFGAWKQVIPLNTVSFNYQLVGFCVCAVSAATSYHVQFGYSEAVTNPPDDEHIMGENRMTLITVPISRSSEMVRVQSQSIPAGGRLMARLKTASGNPDTCEIHVILTRDINVRYEQPLWPTWPW